MAEIDSIIKERFWNKLDMSGGAESCWLWTSYRNKGGYGQFGVNGKIWRAHRLAWTIVNGDIPEDRWINHTCDNPPCCNPKHLWPGTAMEGVIDKMNKGRGVFPGPTRPAVGDKHGRAKLTDTQVEQIRKEFEKGTILRIISTNFGVSVRHLSNIKRGTYRQRP